MASGMHHGPIDLGFQEIGGRTPRLGVQSVHPEERQIQVQRLDGGRGQRTDEGVGGRTHSTGQQRVDAVARPLVQDVADPHGVGHHRQAGDVGQIARERMGSRARRHRDRHPWGHEFDGARRDSFLLHQIARGLGGELGLRRGALTRERVGERPRATVHLLQESGALHRGEVTPDRHVGDAQLRAQVTDSDGAVLVQVGQNLGPALRSQHHRARPASSRITATPPAGT
jgi:hypothetical protein